MIGSPRRTTLLLAGSVIALTGCSDMSQTLGLTRDPPDEFAVTTRAPLAMPPEYTLSPPRPGVPRPQEQSERQKAEEALVPQTALGTPPTSPSPGQEALVQAAGPAVASNIRTEVDQEAKSNESHEGFFGKLMFWRKPQPPGIVVDPRKEAQRLRENSALGQSQETGDTPVVQPKKRGLFEGLF